MTEPPFTEFEVAVEARAELGEGPRWDAAAATLLWVDIPGHRVHRYDPATGRDAEELRAPRREPGAAAAEWRRRHRATGNGCVCSTANGRRCWSPRGGTDRHAHQRRRLRRRRTAVGGHDVRRRVFAVGGLYRVDADLSVTALLTGTTISNGLGWSPSGDRFYFIDSPTRQVDSFDFDLESGALEGRRRFAAVEVEGAVPDGLTVDAEGGVWVALHGGWGLRRYAPDGQLAAVVDLPVARVTSCCFGGADLRDLYVTTRREGLSASELAAQPLAGALLRLDVGVAGLPTHAFAG